MRPNKLFAPVLSLVFLFNTSLAFAQVQAQAPAITRAKTVAQAPATTRAKVVAQAPATTPSTATPQSPINPVSNRTEQSLSPPAASGQFAEKAQASGHPRVIVALGGGGCKSIAEIGVLRSLERHHIPIDGVVGTSMGAVIGALYCSGMPLDQIEQLFVSGEIQTSLMSHIKLKTAIRPLASIAHMVAGRPYAGITGGKAFLSLLKKNLPPTFDQLKIPFGAVATNLTDGQTTVLSEGDLPKSVMASNVVPVIFRPVMINGKLYVDGGLKANLPAKVAADTGTDVVIAVLCDKAMGPESNEKFKTIKGVVGRVTDITLASIDKEQIKGCDVLIYPNADAIDAVSKDKALLKNGVAAGQAAGDEAIPKIYHELMAKGIQIPARESASTGVRQE